MKKVFIYLFSVIFSISLNATITVENRLSVFDLNLPHNSKVVINGTTYTHIINGELDFWTDNPSGDGQEYATEIFTKGDRSKLPKITHTGVVTLSKELGTARLFSGNKTKSSIDNDFYRWYYSTDSNAQSLANSTSWSILGNFDLPSRQLDQTIAIDSTDNLYVAYRDLRNSYKVIVKKYNQEENKWDSLGSENGISQSSAWYISMKIDANDVPYIIYKSNSKVIVQKYDQSNNDWVKLGLDEIDIRNGRYMSLSFDKYNIPHIIYTDDRNSNKAVVRKYDSQLNQWNVLGSTSGISLGSASYIQIEFDKNNLPHAMFTDQGDNSRVVIKEYNVDDNTWEVRAKSIRSYRYAQSLMFNDSNRLYFAYKAYGRTFVVQHTKLVGTRTLSNYSISYSPTSNILLQIDNNDKIYAKYSGGIREYNKSQNRWQWSNIQNNRLFSNMYKGNYAINSKGEYITFGYDSSQRNTIAKKQVFLDKNLVDYDTALTISDVYEKNSDVVFYQNKFYHKNIINGEICYKSKYNDHLILENNISLKFNGILPSNMTCKSILYEDDSIVLTNRSDIVHFGLSRDVTVKLNNAIYTHIIDYSKEQRLDFWTDNSTGDGQEFATEIFTKGDRSNLPTITHNGVNVLTKELGSHPIYSDNGIKSSLDPSFYKWIYTDNQEISTFVDYKKTAYIGSPSYISEGYAYDISLALDSNDIPYVAYKDKGKKYSYQTSYKAHVKKYNTLTNKWEKLGISNISTGSSYKTTIAIDNDDVPYIFFADSKKSYKAIVKKYNANTQQWDLLGEDGISSGSAYDFLSIDIDKDNIPYIAYVDRGKSYKVIVKKYNKDLNKWEKLSTEDISQSNAYYVTLKIDKNNTPYIAYGDRQKSFKAIVKKYDVTNDQWVTVGEEGVSKGRAYNIAFALDNDDIPYIVYKDRGDSYNTIVKKYNTSLNSWEDISTSGLSKGSNFKLEISRENVLYLLYNSTLKRFNKDSNKWEQVGENKFSVGSASDLSLALNSSGVPYIGYKDRWHSSKTLVKSLSIFSKNLVDIVPGGDVIPPLKPSLISSVPTDTFEDTLQIEINGEVGANIFINGEYQNINISDDGKASISLDLSNGYGEKVFNITLKDEAENESEALEIRIEKLKPIPIVLNDSNSDGIIVVNINENSKDVINIEAIDPKNLALNYSLVNENDVSLFNIDQSTGLISFKMTPDFETPLSINQNNIYQIKVQVTNSVGGSITKGIQINVQNLNDNIPIISTVDLFSVREHSSLNLVNIEASDRDGDNLQFSLLGTNQNDFILTGNNISFKTLPDFEVKKQYDINISAFDGNHTVNKLIHINIENDDIVVNKPNIDINNSFTNKDAVSVGINGEYNTTLYINSVNTDIKIPQSGTLQVDLNTSGEDGNKTFEIYLLGAYNDRSDLLFVNIHKDTVSPTIEMITHETNEILTEQNSTVSFQVSDNFSGLDINQTMIKHNGEYVLSEFQFNEQNKSIVIVLNNKLNYGYNYFYINAKDYATNEINRTFNIFVQEQKELYARPVPFVTEIEGTPATIKFGYDVNTDKAITYYKWDFNGDGLIDRQSMMPEIHDWTYENEGEYNVTLEVVDTDNNIFKGSVIVTIKEDVPSPPLTKENGQIYIYPSNGKKPLNTTIAFFNSFWQEIQLIEWDIDGDSIYEYSADVPFVTHSYEQIGDYNVSARVTYDDNTTIIYNSLQSQVKVHNDDIPSVWLNAPYTTSYIQSDINFSVQKFDVNNTLIDFEDNETLTYEWDFNGDGIYDQITDESNITYLYEDVGIYIAKVKVNFSNGYSIYDTKLIDIKINPDIENQLPTFSRDNDTVDLSQNEFVSINITLPYKTKTKIIIEDTKFNQVDTIEHWSSKNIGEHTLNWYPNNIIKEDKYFIVLLYEDIYGNVKRIDLRNTTGGLKYNPIRNWAEYNFYPFDNKPLEIEFTLPNASDVISFVGHTYSTTRVVTLRNMQSLGKGTYTDKWYSQDMDGMLLELPNNKQYMYGVWAYTIADNGVFVKNGAHISNLSSTPPIYTPDSHNENGEQLKLKLEFELTKEANIELELYNADTGGLVTTRLYHNVQAGDQIITFDGKNNQGVYLHPGKYTLGIRAVEQNGYRSMMKYTLIRIKY
jgi:hypothetical protein